MDPSVLWYQFEELEHLDSPALVVFKERIQQNISHMIRIAGNPDRLMPHVKTYKMTEIVRMQLEAGIKNFKCATIAEAELLGLAGAREALLAFQPSELKFKRLLELVSAYPDTRYSVIIDNKETAYMISSLLEKYNTELDVYIDINNGNNRTGIKTEKAYDLIDQLLGLRKISIVGLHIYDGHIRIRNFEERKIVCNTDFEPVNMLIRKIYDQKRMEIKVIAGGSPTFTIHARREKVICSPGTTLLWDAGYGSMFPDLPFLPAAILITRVISIPDDGLLCLDLGHKSVASENTLEKRIYFLNAKGLEPIAQSEEHLVVKNTNHIPLDTGDILVGIPYHICPTVALYQEVSVVDKKKIIGSWEVVARKRKINF